MKHLIAEGIFYRAYSIKNRITIERINSNTCIILSQEDTQFFYEEMSYYIGVEDEECLVDILCSDFDEFMCVPRISQALALEACA